LAVAATLALVVAIVTLAAPRIPVSASLRLQSVDVLWIEPFWKQLTGFSVLGLVALGLGLPLRKRIKSFQLGDFSLWRVLHGLLGAAGLVALFLHSGFRLGENLNFVLMVAFLTSALSGALAGLLAVSGAGEDRNQHRMTASKVARSLHDVSFWPLPILVGFHVFKVYYY
jgi:nitrite reductase (NADH) large subunit